ncbi:MAG: YaiI/YqxD family protein [Gammaproteobacteria bacterium]|nr:YaiI/YqxD family protein [Gammaproteobacteria bacterium]
MRSLWIDADACPVMIRDILFRAADRAALRLTLVANSPITTPGSKHIRAVQVAKGFDAADHYIAERVQPGDLVVTQDIPLAAEVVAKGAIGLNPRGELYTAENVASRLTMRDIADELRGMGEIRGGPSAYGTKEKHAFARQLDRWIAAGR